MDKYIKNIQEFANKHKVIFEDKGKCGFGRKCVGLLAKGGSWLDYNPTDRDYEYRDGLYDERFDDIVPEDAYHKHDCFAVLGRGDDAIRQLSGWVDRLNEIGVEVVDYETGNEGIQATIFGLIGYSVKAIK